MLDEPKAKQTSPHIHKTPFFSTSSKYWHWKLREVLEGIKTSGVGWHRKGHGDNLLAWEVTAQPWVPQQRSGTAQPQLLWGLMLSAAVAFEWLCKWKNR